MQPPRRSAGDPPLGESSERDQTRHRDDRELEPHIEHRRGVRHHTHTHRARQPGETVTAPPPPAGEPRREHHAPRPQRARLAAGQDHVAAREHRGHEYRHPARRTNPPQSRCHQHGHDREVRPAHRHEVREPRRTEVLLGGGPREPSTIAQCHTGDKPGAATARGFDPPTGPDPQPTGQATQARGPALSPDCPRCEPAHLAASVREPSPLVTPDCSRGPPHGDALAHLGHRGVAGQGDLCADGPSRGGIRAQPHPRAELALARIRDHHSGE